MKENKAIPKWVNVVMLILVVGGVAGVLYNITHAFDVFTILLDVLRLAAFVCAIIYGFKGYSKKASSYFKTYVWSLIVYFAGSIIVLINALVKGVEGAGSTLNSSIINAVILVLQLVSLCMLAGKDLGEKNSNICVIIPIVCQLVFIVLCRNINPSLSIQLGTSIIPLLMLYVMIYAKYKAKKARSSK